MDLKQWAQNILKDVKVDLEDAFDRNFQNKAFFDRKWNQTKIPNRIGSLMMRSGNLRNSINSRIEGDQIIFTSSLPYATIHNNGGEIEVTEKMKKYFWAKYIEVAGIIKNSDGKTDWKNTTKIEKGENGSYKITDSNNRTGSIAEFYKAMALMKIGSKIKIEQRQFIGNHPRVEQIITEVLQDAEKELSEIIKNNIQK